MVPQATFRSSTASLFGEGVPLRAFVYHDYQIAPHDHEFYELNLILNGRGTHQISKRVVEVRAGDVFMIPPNVTHMYCNTHRLDVFHILLQPFFLQGNVAESAQVEGFCLLTEVEPFLRLGPSPLNFLHLSQEQLLQIRPDLDLLEQKTPPQKTDPIAIHVTWKLLYQFSAELVKQAYTKTSGTAKYESEILQTLEYIHLHYNEKITIETLCAESFLSRSTFLRSFQAICGCTPIQYLHRYRHQKALELLKNENVSQTEVAQLCGYYDQSHMKRALRTAHHTDHT